MKNTHISYSPEALLAEYTPLVVRTVRGYLSDPEDIREVVNDTFFEFYRDRERVDAEKGGIPAFLATIARRNAIDRLRSNKRRPAQESFETGDSEPEAPIDIEGAVTDRMAVEEALGALDEDELELIRARYYDGKTLHEIAEEMHLPYETVKKRHQRSIKKMRLALLLVIIIALFLAGCAAYVAKQMGIIPGFGVSTSEDEHFYTLPAPVSVPVPDTDLTLTYTSVTCEGNTLMFQFTLTDAEGKDLLDAYADQSQYYISHDFYQSTAAIGDTVLTYSGSDYCTDPDTGVTTWAAMIYEYDQTFDEIIGALDDPSAPVVTFRLICDFNVTDNTKSPDTDGYYAESISLDVTAQLPLAEISAETMDDYAYEYVDGQGGLIAIPRLQDGHLIVALYPIQPEAGMIYPRLTETAFFSNSSASSLTADLPAPTITAVAEDGAVLTGTCTADLDNSILFSYYYEWDFGPAQPGDYTIVVPYLLKSYGFSNKVYLASMDLNDCTFSSRKLRFDGGTIQMTGLKSVTAEELTAQGYDLTDYALDEFPQSLMWIFETDIELDGEDETAIHVSWDEKRNNPLATFFSINEIINTDDKELPNQKLLSSEPDSHLTFLDIWLNGQLYYDGDEPKHYLYIQEIHEPDIRRRNLAKGITSRWDHRFELEVTVE